MIASITGLLRSVLDDRVVVAAGPIAYELLIPAIDAEPLRASEGTEATFHTLFFLQGDGNNFEPTLIGFRTAHDKRFFERFVTVKGIGPRTALRALTVPTTDIAHAVERKDAKFLTGLKGIGKRTAELIVAELSGKLGPFLGDSLTGPTTPAKAPLKFTNADEDAIGALVSLGERRTDAEALLDKARALHPNMTASDQMIREMLRLRSVR
jgi:Holliday junction DNA helicase RuvA